MTAPAKRLQEYGPLLYEIVGRLPAPTILDPGSLHPQTLVQYLRETRQAVEHGFILKNRDAFEKYKRDLIFTVTPDNFVKACLRKDLVRGNPDKGVKPVSDITAEPHLIITRCDFDTLSHLAILLALRAFSPHPSFVLRDPAPGVIERLESLFDVAIAQIENTTDYLMT